MSVHNRQCFLVASLIAAFLVCGTKISEYFCVSCQI